MEQSGQAKISFYRNISKQLGEVYLWILVWFVKVLNFVILSWARQNYCVTSRREKTEFNNFVTQMTYKLICGGSIIYLLSLDRHVRLTWNTPDKILGRPRSDTIYNMTTFVMVSGLENMSLSRLALFPLGCEAKTLFLIMECLICPVSRAGKKHIWCFCVLFV